MPYIFISLFFGFACYSIFCCILPYPELRYRAAFVLLNVYIARHGCNTLRKVIQRWAPPSDGNDTAAYLRHVLRHTEVEADEPLHAQDAQQMIPIVCAMSMVENGQPARLNDVVEAWGMQ